MFGSLPMWKNRNISCKYMYFQFLLRNPPLPPRTLAGPLHSAPLCHGHRPWGRHGAITGPGPSSSSVCGDLGQPPHLSPCLWDGSATFPPEAAVTPEGATASPAAALWVAADPAPPARLPGRRPVEGLTRSNRPPGLAAHHSHRTGVMTRVSAVHLKNR